MVLLAISNESESKERPKITAFQNWFNKNQKRLEEEFMEYARKEFYDNTK